MILGRIIAPYTQLQDFGGRNNTRGLMYVYVEPNTTKRATLYKESTHEELTNPLVINDVGQVEDFVVDADYKYWILVTDLDNNKIFDRHNLATMEEGGGNESNRYYDGDFTHIDENNRINVTPTKQLSFENPIIVKETEDEIQIGVDTSNISLNIEGSNGVSVSKSGKKWIISGKTLDDKNKTQDEDINNIKTWQNNHGKSLTINVDNKSTTYDGSTNQTVDIPKVNNGTLTIKQGDNVKGTFNANQETNSEIKLDYANNASIRLLNDAGTVIGDFTVDQAVNKDIVITRDLLDVYSKSQVDAKIPSTIPMTLTVAPGFSDSPNRVTFISDLSGIQQGSIYINTPSFSNTLYTVPGYGTADVEKSLTVKYDETKETYYLAWNDNKPKMTVIDLGNSIYYSSPKMAGQSSGTVLSVLGNIPKPIQLSAGKTYLIQPSVIGTSDYTLATSYNGDARFSLEIKLAEADVTEGSFARLEKVVSIAKSQFYLDDIKGSNLAGYRFITPIGSPSLLFTPKTDLTFTKLIIMNSGNVLGGNGSTKCWMDFVLGSLVITEV